MTSLAAAFHFALEQQTPCPDSRLVPSTISGVDNAGILTTVVLVRAGPQSQVAVLLLLPVMLQ